MKKELLARGTPEDVERAEKLRTPFQGGDRQCVSHSLQYLIFTNLTSSLPNPPPHFTTLNPLTANISNTKRNLNSDDGAYSWKHLFAKSIIRPFALFASEPIIQLLGAYMAFIYGILYLVLTTIPSIYQGEGSIYGEKVRFR